MPFTDDDLKELKAETMYQIYKGSRGITIMLDDLKALLDRLEVAEQCLRLPHSCVPLEENNCSARSLGVIFSPPCTH